MSEHPSPVHPADTASRRPDLRLDWCSHEAAKFACERWHYSRSLSSARNVFIGTWEAGHFAGAVVFGIGSGAVTDGRRFGLGRNCEVAELTRVALKRDHSAPVSRIVAIAVRLLRTQSPGLRLLISFADPARGHLGGIYQAAGWTYTGETKSDVEYYVAGSWVHHRTATSRGSAAGLPSRRTPPKHRYLLPLDAEMRERIASLAKPYPKRVKQATEGHPPTGGGAAPTHTLHDTAAERTRAKVAA